jgi:hypothetical protein
MHFHVYSSSSKCYSFGLQPEALFESVISAKFNGASGAQNTLPRQPHRAAQGCHDLARSTGESRSFRDCAVGGDFASGNAADRSRDSFAHVGLWEWHVVSLKYLSG